MPSPTTVICARCGSHVADLDASSSAPRWFATGSTSVLAEVAAGESATPLEAMPACGRCGPIKLRAGALRDARNGASKLRADPVHAS